MFTGIVETIGTIQTIRPHGTNRVFRILSPISQELQIDQSVSHNGACLTVVGVENNEHQVIAVDETLQKTNLLSLKPGSPVNLERAMTLQKRLDGHMVQGHVDATGTCIEKREKNGSHEFRFQFPTEFAHLVIEKGSIALNGISLTLFDVTRDAFSIAIIPYTYDHTTMQRVQLGDSVNLEFDLIGKYVARLAAVNQEEKAVFL